MIIIYTSSEFLPRKLKRIILRAIIISKIQQAGGSQHLRISQLSYALAIVFQKK